MRRLINGCWSVFKWGFVLLLAAALAGGGYLYFRLDEEIRRYAEGALAQHYTGLDVRVGGARFVPGQGVVVYDISLAEPEQPSLVVTPSPTAGQTLLSIAELSLEGRFDVQQLLEGKPRIDRVVLRRPVLTAHRRADGAWTTQALAALPDFGGSGAPRAAVKVVGATVVVADASKPMAPIVTLRNLNAWTEPQRQGDPAGVVRLRATAEETLAKRIGLQAELNLGTGGVELGGDFSGLRLTSDLLAAAPESTRRRLAGLQAAASAAGRVTLKRADRAAPWAWGGVVSVSDGAIRHPRLPRPLTELRATASFNAAGVAVRSLSAKLGAAEITGALNHTGWRAGGPIALQGRVRGLTLDQPLRAALPQRLQTLWRRFKPAGVVDVALQSRYGDHRWRHDATIDCRTLSVEDSERFPYRLTNAQGTARLADAGEPGQGRCALQLRGLAEGRPVVIAAEFRGLPCPGDPPRPPPPGPRPICPVGWVEINAPQLRASEALLAAIRPHRQAAAIARALAPTGDFGARWRLDRPTADQLQPAMEIDLRALGCSIRYDKFPYPIHGIYGDLRLRNGVWSFDRLESRSATGPQVIVASGGLAPEDGRQTFRMRLTATAARLDEPLRRALPEREQAVWSRLRPAGRVSLTTDVLYRVGDAAPQIAIVAEPFERSVSLEPDFFPYRLSRLGGRFVMRDGRMSFTGGLAEHGRSRFAAAGSWTPLDAGGWRFELTGLSADYLDADHDLRLAAPIALRRVIDEVQPEGGFGLHDGRLAFTYDPRRPDDLRTDWDVELDCHQADVTFGSRVEGVSGAVRLTGVSTGGDCRAYGQLQLDTMFWNGLQLTNVRGPLWAGAGECLLGEGVAAKLPGAKSERITAQVYGGTAAINTRAVYSEGTRYSMAIDLAGIDLGRFSTDYLNTEAPLTGVAGGRMLLSGKGSSVFGIEGSGTMQVRDADLYQLPVMVALLKVLSNRTPDTRAFDGVNAEFTVQGKHLQFSRLDLVGDAVSLNGRGEASLDKNVNLTFHTIVGRTSDRFSMLRSLVGQASEQILRVRVLGTIDNPDIRRDALPVVGSVLEQLRADLQPRPLSQPSNTPQAAALRRQSRTQ